LTPASERCASWERSWTQPDALLNLTVEQLDETGNTELLSWCTLLGAIGPQQGELLQYTSTWHHGHSMMRFLPARAKAFTKEAQGRPPYRFRNQGLPVRRIRITLSRRRGVRWVRRGGQLGPQAAGDSSTLPQGSRCQEAGHAGKSCWSGASMPGISPACRGLPSPASPVGRLRSVPVLP